jgi:hypothetical protein
LATEDIVTAVDDPLLDLSVQVLKQT